MFLSVKERARQIALGQFTAPTVTAPAASLIDLAPEPQPAPVAPPRTTPTTPAKEPSSKAAASPSKRTLSKAAPPKEPASKATTAPSQKAPKTAPSKAAPAPVQAPAAKLPSSKATPPPPTPSTPKKPSSKSKLSKPPSTPKLPTSKPTPSKSTPHPKPPPTPKSTTTQKPSKSAASPSKPKRSKSPPKRVDSPLSTTSEDDPLAALKAACLKQVSGVTGLGGRRLAVVLKQRSSGEWYAALKDTGSDKYLKMFMNREKTFATREEALEAYLVFATRMRNGVGLFPLSPRAGKGEGKGKW